MSNDAIHTEARALLAALAAAGQTVATAESCTGGWVGKALTDIAGSSAAYGWGVVSYSNAAKASLLGVRERTLAEHGAVSEAVVREMAEGALEKSGADHALAVSGIAGPGGGTPDKPVGTVWFAWASQAGDGASLDAARALFDGDRDAVRRQSVVHALAGMRERLGA